MPNVKIPIIIFVIVIATSAAIYLYLNGCEECNLVPGKDSTDVAVDFESCSRLGFPVTLSSPAVCRAGDKTFIEILPGADDLIRVYEPLRDAVVSNPVTISGEARGNWYFEASFPVKVLDGNGKLLGIMPAQAQGEWMTTEYVPFSVSLSFSMPETLTGTIVLEKDNPSGLPQFDASISIPVRFENSGGASGSGGGTLNGTMAIGPVCPVERPDEPCLPTPEMFAARKVFVYKSDKTTLVSTLTPDSKGKFTAVLPAGNYYLDMENQGIGGTNGVPATVHISSGASTDISISVDTGIR